MSEITWLFDILFYGGLFISICSLLILIISFYMYRKSGGFNISDKMAKEFVYAFFKRVIDILVSLVSIYLLLPVFIIFSILIKIECQGPIYVKKICYGLNGKSFNLLRFRTTEILTDDHGLTKVGIFLRKTKLDELPQLFNVLNGQMSLVGSNYYFSKNISEHLKKYEADLLDIEEIKPGIVTWSKIKTSNLKGIDEQIKNMQYDYIYLKNRTIFFDFFMFVLYPFKSIVKKILEKNFIKCNVSSINDF